MLNGLNEFCVKFYGPKQSKYLVFFAKSEVFTCSLSSVLLEKKLQY